MKQTPSMKTEISIKDGPLATAVGFSVTDRHNHRNDRSNQQPPNKRPTQNIYKSTVWNSNSKFPNTLIFEL
jgi:hypothetical protein